MRSGRKKYRTVGLPETLYLECERVVREGLYGYSSVSEFVKDAVRRRLEEIKEKMQNR